MEKSNGKTLSADSITNIYDKKSHVASHTECLTFKFKIMPYTFLAQNNVRHLFLVHHYMIKMYLKILIVLTSKLVMIENKEYFEHI